MHVRTLGTLAGAVALLAMSGCTVSRKEYLNTAYGPGKSPETYRVGGLAPETEVGTRVVVVRSADLEVAGASSSAVYLPSTPSASTPSASAPLPVPTAPGMTGGTPYGPTTPPSTPPR